MKKLLHLTIFCLVLCSLLRLPTSVRADSTTICSWTGDSTSSDHWDESDNWMCVGTDSGSHAPTSQDIAQVSDTGSQVPHVWSDAQALSLILTGTLYIDNSSTLTVTTWTSTGGTLSNSTGTLAGAGTIGPGITTICSRHLTGGLTVNALAELKLMASPCGYVYTDEAVTVQPLGKIDTETIDASFFFEGANTFTNNGTVSVPDFFFTPGGTLPVTQHVAGSGSWSGSSITIDENVTLDVDNDLTFDSSLFSISYSSETASLVVGSHAVTFQGGTLNASGDVVGSGERGGQRARMEYLRGQQPDWPERLGHRRES